MAPLRVSLLITIGLSTAALRARAEDEPRKLEADRIDIHTDEEQRTTLRIQAPEGRLEWADLLAGIARARGFDDTALQGALPPGGIDALPVGPVTCCRILDFGFRIFHVPSHDRIY